MKATVLMKQVIRLTLTMITTIQKHSPSLKTAGHGGKAGCYLTTMLILSAGWQFLPEGMLCQQEPVVREAMEKNKHQKVRNCLLMIRELSRPIIG